jgi:hypothetical protein
MADTTGQADIRAEHFDPMVKGFALQSYKMKQLCMVDNSNSWTETYYKETAADLTAGATQDVEGVPRLANFPYGEVSWTKVQGRNVKHGMEGVVSFEDMRTNNIPVVTRTLLRIARAVTKSVDENIYTAMNANAGNTQAANATWNNAVVADRDPIQDILNAKSLIKVDNYDIQRNGYLVIHPTQESEMLGNASVRNAGQFYTDSATRNGVIGRIAGLYVLVTNSASEGTAHVIIAKEAMTWKQLVGLTVKTIEDPGVKWTVRAFELGQCQVNNPDAICAITGV